MQTESTSKSDGWEVAGRKATQMRDQLERQADSSRNEFSQAHVVQRLSTAVKGFSNLRQKMLLGKLTIEALREEGRRF